MQREMPPEACEGKAKKTCRRTSWRSPARSGPGAKARHRPARRAGKIAQPRRLQRAIGPIPQSITERKMALRQRIAAQYRRNGGAAPQHIAHHDAFPCSRAPTRPSLRQGLGNHLSKNIPHHGYIWGNGPNLIASCSCEGRRTQSRLHLAMATSELGSCLRRSTLRSMGHNWPTTTLSRKDPWPDHPAH